MHDALVIGAGPAGSAAAWALAREGRRVALVDRQSFPRDKVCGDALIPDALGALDLMGLRPHVEAQSVRLRELRVYAPRGRVVSLAGEFSCLPRLRFDRLLVDAAVRAGAELIEERTAVAPIVAEGRVTGALFRSTSGEAAMNAPVTLLATGANATPMAAFGLAPSLKPNAVAGRAYFRVPPRIAERSRFLCIAYDREICPGYGWIFPGPENRFNVGVGFFCSGAGPVPSLHALWRRFAATFEPAAAIVRESELLEPFRGAPLRAGLAGARFGRPGLVAIGEAAAMTYSATGEGIGKAMESGLLAARAAMEASADSRVSAHEAYEAEFRRRFEPRYTAYRRAQACAARPWLLDFLAWRANAGTFVRGELEALVDERGDPRRLLSAGGFAAALFR